jgi:hypothetical protein
MALQVIGVGFGRTGTNSLKLALEALGFTPCHHMFEVKTERQLAIWEAVVRGEAMGWDRVFAGFRASVDWPSVRYWRETTAHFPEARVILTERPAERWFASVQATIYPAMRDRAQVADPVRRRRLEMAWEVVVQQTFDGRLDDEAHATAVYRAHGQAVRRAIAPERLLVYDVREGWEPLCRFLEVPIPAADFPRVNTTAAFQQGQSKPAHMPDGSKRHER